MFFSCFGSEMKAKLLTGDLDSHLLVRLLAYMHPLMISDLSYNWSLPHTLHTCRAFFFFSPLTHWLHYIACGILAPWPGIKPAPLVLEGQSPNHWIEREVPQKKFWIIFYTHIYFFILIMLLLITTAMSNTITSLLCAKRYTYLTLRGTWR